MDVATNSGFTIFVPGYSDLDVGNVTSFDISGLATGTTYYYRVRAYSTAGTGTNSNFISRTTVTCPLRPMEPAGLPTASTTPRPRPQTSVPSASPSAVTGIGPWFWDCPGLNGGSTASCSAAQAGGIVYLSTDSGLTWTPTKTGAGLNTGAKPLLVSPTYASDRTLFLGAGGIYKSTDNGDTWTMTQPGYQSIFTCCFTQLCQ